MLTLRVPRSDGTPGNQDAATGGRLMLTAAERGALGGAVIADELETRLTHDPAGKHIVHLLGKELSEWPDCIDYLYDHYWVVVQRTAERIVIRDTNRSTLVAEDAAWDVVEECRELGCVQKKAAGQQRYSVEKEAYKRSQWAFESYIYILAQALAEYL